MLKKLVAALIVLSFVVPITSAQAAVKPGAKCAKLKATTTAGGIKYTCIKSGSKLVWNKGVKVKVASDVMAGVCPPASANDASKGISKERAQTLIGMSESKGQECANTLGWDFRIIEQDGEFFPATKDYRLDRVNVTINSGVIAKVNVG